jgi:hypothetical protein
VLCAGSAWACSEEDDVLLGDVSEQSSTSKVAPPLLVFVLKMEKGRMSPFLTVV